VIGPPRSPLLLSMLCLSAAAESAHLFMQRDLETLLSESEFVARVKITVATLPQSEDSPPLYQANVISTIKGTLPEEIQIVGEGQRSPRYTIGDDEIVFLVRPHDASNKDKATFASIQAGGERWDGQAADDAIETFLKGILAAPPGGSGRGARFRLYLSAIRSAVPRLAAHASTHLALLGRQAPFSAEELDAVTHTVADESVPSRNRTALITSLGADFPASRAVDLLGAVKDPSTRAALLAAASRTVQGEGADRARAVLGAERGSLSADESFAAAVGLANMGDEAALPALREFLVSGDAQQRLQVVLALAALAHQGSHDARVELKVLGQDPDRMVAARASRLYQDLIVESPEHQARTRSGLYLAFCAAILLVVALGVGIRGFANRSAVRSDTKA
jgi:hypothetical protein